MTWDSFIWFASVSSLLWISGAAVSAKSVRRLPAALISGAGSALFLIFIAGFWLELGRPPLRTMGETRLWFSLFLSMTGLAVYLLRGFCWILPFSSMMSVMFVCINVFKPEIHSRALVPALQSPWFVPHVIVYMFAYAVMGVVTILAVHLIRLSGRYSHRIGVGNETAGKFGKADAPERLRADTGFWKELQFCDSLVRMGWGFLTMGIVMGALWAKQAWGDYWTWDPKETWAAATWLGYLLYMHLRQFSMHPGQFPGNPPDSNRLKATRTALYLLLFCFVLLQMCWWGVNLLPSARGFSLHTY